MMVQNKGTGLRIQTFVGQDGREKRPGFANRSSRSLPLPDGADLPDAP